MKRLGIFRVHFAAAFLAGCTTVAVPPERIADVQTVGIISAIGDQAAILEIPGFLDPANLDLTREPTLIDISHWELDAWIIEYMESSLSDRFAFDPVTYEKEPFLLDYGGLRLFATTSANVPEILGTMPPANVDA